MAVITISRQFGAGGKTLGKQAAKQLDYTFADNQIIQMVAETANVSPHWVESIEKEAGTDVAGLAELRRLKSQPIVDEIQAWLLSQRALPQSSLGKAITYTCKLWTGLTRFLDEPRIPLDNNGTFLTGIDG